MLFTLQLLLGIWSLVALGVLVLVAKHLIDGIQGGQARP